MSDENDENVYEMGKQVALMYMVLAATCDLLPIPIRLPRGVVTPDIAIPAIQRVAEIVGDQPMPDEQQGNLFAACVHWLAAQDLYELARNEYTVYREWGVAGNLITCETAVLELGIWVRTEDEKQNPDQE